MINIVYYYRNANQKCNAVSPYIGLWSSSKNLQTINAGEGVEKREPSYTVGGNVNWYNHYGELYGVFFKN